MTALSKVADVDIKGGWKDGEPYVSTFASARMLIPLFVVFRTLH